MVTQEILELVKQRLIKTYNPVEIYLFGSQAWGTPHEDSDLDLLIIVDAPPADRYRALVNGYKALTGIGIAKDLLLYTKQEFNEDSEKTSSICYEIKRKGKQIYARA